MNLEALGWNSFFDAYFQSYRNDSVIPARVVRVEKQHYYLHGEKGEILAELAGKLHHQATSKEDFPVVGDWVVVALRPGENNGIIQGLLPRKTHFSRKAAGVKSEIQVLVANIDYIFIVAGLDLDFNLRRIERYLALAWDSGAEPIIILNKTDVCTDLDEKITLAESIAFGVPIHAVSAQTNEGLESLKSYSQAGKTIALLGSSGVGKSSIINRLLGTDRQLVGEIRENDGRGRHTTSRRELFFMPDGGMIIDNPGLRELQVLTQEDGLLDAFEDIEELAANCRFRNCQHENEPDCAVKAALEDGTLEERRYQNYLKLQREQKYLETRDDDRARSLMNARGKKASQQMKTFYKQK
ncbi:ribosome small subunit-dependent GTPase A [candidate division KSB1 bacterium]|nr:ribosome small subunit-dependent GTPase A [candidate division KSB1 bacterium]